MTGAAAAIRTERRPEGGTVELVPGLHSVRMPLPYALDQANLWLLDAVAVTFGGAATLPSRSR